MTAAERDPRAKDLGSTVGGKERRKVRHRRGRDRSVWFWLGMMGLVGWSVAAPTIVGVAIGVWVDRTWGGRVSWTLTGLVLGALAGCFSAWFWVKKESRQK